MAGLTAWLLYKHVFGLVSALIILPIYKKSYQKAQIEKRKKELLIQFKEAMQSVSAAVLSGFSIENAWREAEKEIETMYGKDAYMTVELKQMNAAVRTNQQIEQLLYQFALRSTCEDILNFAEVFQFAKRSGGNFGKIIQNTINRISEKIEVEKEIQTVISGKKMEQRVMNVVPIFLLCYLNLTSKEFLTPLYGNLFGACVMTLAFLAYMGALILSQKLMDVKL